jgi:hypothetical protein
VKNRTTVILAITASPIQLRAPKFPPIASPNLPVPTWQSQSASPGQFPLPTTLQDIRKMLGGCLTLSLSEFPGIFCRPSAVHLKKILFSFCSASATLR